MNGLTESQVNQIAARLLARMRPPEPVPEPGAALGDGIFADIPSAVSAATKAFERFDGATLALRAEIVAAMRAAMEREGAALAKLAWSETSLGRLEDKVVKNRLVARKTPGPEALTPTAWTGDHGLTLIEHAPYGVIGAITPVTNPTATIIGNAIGMLAAGNSAVFNVHPSARACSMRVIRLLNRVIVEAGGPPNLITAPMEPTIESAQELMKHPGIRLLVVTGGAGVVKAAMESGKRAICAGPGNPPVVVDETADLPAAARAIVQGASFDNNIICVDEKEVFVVASAAEGLLAAMRAKGAHLLEVGMLRRLEAEIFTEERGPGRAAVMNKDLIGKNASEILARIGVRCGPEVRLVIAEVPESHPLVWSEQMMPVLPIVRVPDVARGIELARQAEQGCEHSAAMHSRDIDALSRMARVINTSIFVKNGPIYAGLGEGGEGFTSFTIASPTGEGLTGPLSFSRQRRCVMVDHFRIV